MTGFRKLLVVAAGISAAAAVAAGVSSAQGNDPGWGGIPHCSVPNVKKLQLTVAKARLKNARCLPGLITRKRSSVKKGRVYMQVPDPGTQCAPQTQVDLYVSKGRR
jgi:PASTA domain